MMARDLPHYRAYLQARDTAEALLMAHARADHDLDGFHVVLAERHFRWLAAELGFRVEKIETVASIAAVQIAEAA